MFFGPDVATAEGMAHGVVGGLLTDLDERAMAGLVARATDLMLCTDDVAGVAQ